MLRRNAPMQMGWKREEDEMGEPNVVSELEGPCPVCTAASVRSDAVERSPRVWIGLAECGRCGHRWTGPAPEPVAAARGALRAGAASAREEGARAA